MTRDEGVGILTFITEWESNFEKFKNLELKLVTLVDLIFYILAIWLKRTGILFLRTLMHWKWITWDRMLPRVSENVTTTKCLKLRSSNFSECRSWIRRWNTGGFSVGCPPVSTPDALSPLNFINYLKFSYILHWINSMNIITCYTK